MREGQGGPQERRIIQDRRVCQGFYLQLKGALELEVSLLHYIISQKIRKYRILERKIKLKPSIRLQYHQCELMFPSRAAKGVGAYITLAESDPIIDL